MEKSNPCHDLNELVKTNNTSENVSNLAECLIQNPDATLDLNQTAPLKIETVWTIVTETRKDVVEFNSEVCLASDWEIPEFPEWSSQRFLWENIDIWLPRASNIENQVQIPFDIPVEEKDTTVEATPIPEPTPIPVIETPVEPVLTPTVAPTPVPTVEPNTTVEPKVEIENKKTTYEVKSWDNLWSIVKNHYNLSVDLDVLNKVKEVINLQTDSKLKNKLLKSKWNLIHIWDKIELP